MIKVIKFTGQKCYSQIYELMQAKAIKIAQEESDGEIWLVEHESVYTVGIRGDMADLVSINERLKERFKKGTESESISSNISVTETDRGGLITWHGKGQRVIYMIINIRKLFDNSLNEFLKFVYSNMIDTLQEFGVPSYRKFDLPGIWIRQIAGKNLSRSRIQADERKDRWRDEEKCKIQAEEERDQIRANEWKIQAQINEGSKSKKIASIGLKIKNGVSYHGIAVNVHNDVRYFDVINPCGIEEKEIMTSIYSEIGKYVDLACFDEVLLKNLMMSTEKWNVKFEENIIENNIT